MYQKEVRQRKLNTFCVGNKDYESRDLFYKESKILAVKKSGIPELRQFCHSIVSRAQFRAGTHFLETEIPDLIQMLRVWIEAADQITPLNIPQDTAQKLQVVSISSFTVADPRSELCQRISTLIDEVLEDVETHFKSRILEKFSELYRP